MTKLWIKFKTYNATQVSTEECQDVDDFLRQCKKKLLFLYGQFPPGELSLSMTEGSTPLQPDDPIPTHNTAKSPLIISVAVVEQVPKEEVSMSYGKATMAFISEATGVEDENQVWENIPVDTTVEASPEFVELFKKNCSVVEFGAEASRRTLIFFFGK